MREPGRAEARLQSRSSAPQMRVFCALLAMTTVNCGRVRSADDIRAELLKSPQVVELPAGQIHLDKPLFIPKGSRNLTLRGNAAGSTLVLDPGFKGTAAIEADGVSGLTLSGFTIIGDRTEMKSDWYLPLKEAAFADYYTANGIVIRNSTDVTISGVTISRIRAFPIIVNATSKSLIDSVTVEDSGTLNREGHNNTTGGILIEEGSTNFEVRNSTMIRIAGNAIWTHSYARSPRQADGAIRNNVIATIARDAIQIGHATRVRVENNKGSEIGFPVDYVDFPGYGTPVAIDTAGNVDHAVYANNEFTSVAGQCLDLDGFHDGEITGNQCINDLSNATKWLGLHFGIFFGNHDPGMTSTNVTITHNTIQGFAYGGIFLIGDHHRIEDNRFLNVNLADCGAKPASAKCAALTDQPDALRSGIYLSDDGGRKTATRDNIIRNNVVTGVFDKRYCITAKQGIDLKADTIAGNSCLAAPTE